MKTIWSWIKAFGMFWYGFIIGDDWTVAAAVAVGVAATWFLARAGITAWWLLPPIVVIIVGLSIWRLERQTDQ